MPAGKGESVSVGLSMRDASRSRSASSNPYPPGTPRSRSCASAKRGLREAPGEEEGRQADSRQKAKRCAAVAAFQNPRPSQDFAIINCKVPLCKPLLSLGGTCDFISVWNSISLR